MHSNFRCVFPSNPRKDDNVFLFNNPRGRCPSGQVFNPVLRTCTGGSRSAFPAGLESASLTRDDPENCRPGTIFVPEIGLCLEAQKPLRTEPLKSDNFRIDTPRLEISAFSNHQSPKDCKQGEIFNSELGICLDVPSGNFPRRPLASASLVREKSVASAVAPLEIRSFASSQTEDDCKQGEMFVYEIGACVPTRSSRSPEPANQVRPLESASLVKESVSPLVNFPKITKSSDCESGEIFVPEIGICMPVEPPKELPPPSSDSLVKEEAPPVPIAVAPLRCPPGQINVPELGICLPAQPPSSNQAPPQSSSLIKEPAKLELESFKESKDHSDCPTGQFFVAEIGICL
ncbi:hypothetical protein FHG87_011963 [Trinorchestia longiramus]|nr:hypothetical protein FHG87_011963 [Trinorchestia longiramus]